MNKTKIILKSIFAGIMIAIGTLSYLSAPTPYIGAMVFSIGLLLVMENGFPLYTGQIGRANKVREVVNTYFPIFLLNLIGTLCLLMFPPNPLATAILINKMAMSASLIFIKAIFCGVLMQLAVTTKNRFISAFCVFTFIVCGFEHSIANFCYMAIGRLFTFQSFCFTGLVMCGNSIGSIITRKIQE